MVYTYLFVFTPTLSNPILFVHGSLPIANNICEKTTLFIHISFETFDLGFCIYFKDIIAINKRTYS